MRDYTAKVKRWYRSKRWRDLRDRVLKQRQWCECPHHKGTKELRADVVDHIKAHRGNPRLFWNPKNLQAMAKVCHDRFKQSDEKGGVGFDGACDATGMPLNPAHPWYA